MATNNYYTKTIKHSLKAKEIIATSFLMPYNVAIKHNPLIDLQQYYNFNFESDGHVNAEYLMNPRGDSALTEFVYDDNNVLIEYSCNVLRELFTLMVNDLWTDFCDATNLKLDKEKLAKLVWGLDKRDPEIYKTVDESKKDAFRFYSCIERLAYNANKDATKIWLSDPAGILAPQEVDKHATLFYLDGIYWEHGINLENDTLLANLYPCFRTPSIISVVSTEFSSQPILSTSLASQKQEYLQKLNTFLTNEDYEYIIENTNENNRFYLSIEWDADGKIDDIIFHDIPVYKFAS